MVLVRFISKEPFEIKTEASRPNSTSSWWTPIRLTHAKSTSFGDSEATLWLSPRTPTLEMVAPSCRNAWILVNYEMNGFFRVNYDRRNWQLLAMQLRYNHSFIPPVTRAQLIDDAFWLARAGVIDYDIPYDVIKYLDHVNDDEFIVSAALDHIEYLQQMEADDTNDVSYPDSVQRVKLPRGSSHGRRQFSASQSPSVALSEQLFRAQMNHSISDDQFRLVSKHFETVWCHAIRNGDQNHWQFVWKSIHQLESPQQQKLGGDKKKMLKALACSKDSERLKQLLSRIFQPDIHQLPAETWAIVKTIGDHPSGRSLALQFVIKHWDLLSTHFRDTSRSYELLAAVTRYSKSIGELEKVKEHLDSQVEHAMAGDILNTMRNNMKWRQIRHHNEL